MICELYFHHCDLSRGRLASAGLEPAGMAGSLNYGKITSIALDPIEKKPLRRFHPSSKILSVGSFGCNLRCPFCQNHEISMSGEKELERVELSPEALADKALEMRSYGNIGVAYTYNEPLVGYEYVQDCAATGDRKALHHFGGGTVSCGGDHVAGPPARTTAWRRRGSILLLCILEIIEENWDAFIAKNIRGWYNKTNCVKPWAGMSMSNDTITEVGINIQEWAKRCTRRCRGYVSLSPQCPGGI